MKRSLKRSSRRKGAIAPLTALLMIPIMGMMAFSIDVGYIVQVKAELQNAADSAALAGATRLQNLYVLYYIPGQLQQSQIFTKATTNTGTSDCPTYTAEQYAYLNQAGGVYLTVPDSDVTFSYEDGINPPQPAVYPTTFPNTITVVTRRDNNANGPIGLFFAKVFGINTSSLTATASATIYAGNVNSLQVISGVNAHILPVALDVNVWKVFYATGVSPDGLIHPGPNGAPQLHVYPTPANAPGNFGLLDVGPPANNAPAFRDWINNGETPNDIQYMLNNNLLPVSPQAPQWWKCGPGLTDTLLSNFQSVIGEPNMIPLFIAVSQSPYQAAQGQGQGSTYNICGFAAVAVSEAHGNGDNMNISIQPMALVDPTAIIPDASPARPSLLTWFNTQQTTFVSAKLTQPVTTTGTGTSSGSQ
jgi:Flp pilus assembly protein TadG